MRIAVATIIVSITALVLPTAQALARNSTTSQKSESSIKAPCSSYTQNTDGTWTPIPCEEAGSKSQMRTKPVDGSDDQH